MLSIFLSPVVAEPGHTMEEINAFAEKAKAAVRAAAEKVLANDFQGSASDVSIASALSEWHDQHFAGVAYLPNLITAEMVRESRS